MKRSLLVTIDFSPRLGGVANYLSNICQNLPSQDIVVLAPREGQFLEFDQRQDYKIYRNKLISNFIWPKWLFLFTKVYKVIKKEKIKVLQISHVLPVGYVALIFKKFLNLPYIVYTHGMDIMFAQKSSWKKYWAKKILTNAFKVVANSDYTKNELLKLGLDEKSIKIVYPCPNINNQQPTTNNQDIIKKYALENKKILLTVGRLVERKGHDVVIKALSRILEKIPNLVYLIVGSGKNKENLLSLVKELKLEENVRFIEDVKDRELPLFYEICDVFIMTPREIKGDVEGFGIVYLEAGSFEKPVIGSKSGGVAEAVEDGVSGILVNPENTEQISEAVINLLTNKELVNKLGQGGRQRIEKEFNWPNQVKKIKEILEYV